MDLTAWLTGQDLRRLEPLLRQAGIDLDVLCDLDNFDLERIGLSLGDQKRLLKSINASPPVRTIDDVNRATTHQSDSAVHAAAERRHLTVMFCDLVGSTALSAHLDPEDLRQVIDTYQRAIAAAVAPYDGHIAQFLGDGVLVYFGYPTAHEDDADRAVRAGMAAQDVMTRLQPRGDLQLRARIGIASGLVVVGEIGVGTPVAELSASGQTPNLAARLQGFAQPGEIVISAGTRKLLGASFELEALGALELKGFDTAILAWRVLGERAAASRFEAQHLQELTRIIGRESEVSMLLERWAMGRDGEGQLVMLSGEAGIGKSRISEALRQRLEGEPFTTVLWQCSPYFATSALYPVVQQLERAAEIVAADSPQASARKLDLRLRVSGLGSEPIGYLLNLLGLPDGGRMPAQQAPQQVKARTLGAVVDVLHGLSQREPLLLLVEDAHWIDPTTEELLAVAIEKLRQARVLILITSRPDYTPSWGNPAHLTRLPLSRLGQRQSTALIASVTCGKTLPEEVVAQIVKKADGIPLFVEELTKTVIESGLLSETPSGYKLNGPLPALAIPSTLQDSLTSRLDRLAPAKEVAQVAATIGREFSHGLLAAALSGMSDVKLNESIENLVMSELIFRRGATPNLSYSFKHALVRDAAYNSMVKAQRALRHRQIAEAIEKHEPDVVATQPELLAHHQQEAGNLTEAFAYWIKAGDLASTQQAIREAVKQYQVALSLFGHLEPERQTTQIELDLQMKLGSVLMNSEGYRSAATQASFARALELSTKLGDVTSYVTVCAAGAPTMYAAGHFNGVLETFNRIRPETLASAGPVTQLEHLMSVGIPQFHLGQYGDAWDNLDAATRLCDTERVLHGHMVGGGASRVAIRAYAARVRGYSEHLPLLNAEWVILRHVEHLNEELR